MGVHPSHILPGTDKSFRYALPRLKAVVKCSVQLTGEIETKTSCMSRPGRAGMMSYLLHSIMFPTLHGGAPCQTVVPSFGEVKNKSDLTGLPPRHTECTESKCKWCEMSPGRRRVRSGFAKLALVNRLRMCLVQVMVAWGEEV